MHSKEMRRSRDFEVDLSDRLTRLEVADHYNKRIVQDHGNSINRIGNNVIVNSNALTQMQGELNEIKPAVAQFQDIQQFLMTGRKVLIWMRGFFNFFLAAAIMYAWFEGKITAENAKSIIKVAGLTG